MNVSSDSMDILEKIGRLKKNFITSEKRMVSGPVSVYLFQRFDRTFQIGFRLCKKILNGFLDLRCGILHGLFDIPLPFFAGYQIPCDFGKIIHGCDNSICCTADSGIDWRVIVTGDRFRVHYPPSLFKMAVCSCRLNHLLPYWIVLFYDDNRNTFQKKTVFPKTKEKASL